LQSVARTSDGDEVEALRRELQDAMVLLEQQQLAAALDVEGIRRAVEPAVAMVWSEWPDGRVTTGTAVSIGDGTLLTSRHVVAPEGRGEGERLAVQFAGSTQVWRADLLDVHPGVDLAWIRPDGIVGEIPSLDAFNPRVDTLAPGSPMAIVGFSLGGRAQVVADGSRPRAIVSTGVLVGSTVDELRIRGYGAEGASGSPVVDRDGRLVGVVYGGTDEGGQRILVAVPIRYSLEAEGGPG
jgi:S1-C subfamily serine protease